MSVVRRSACVALGIACLHVVFGAIVRISGSGMGCGNDWPKCNGAWIPPMDRPDLIVEVTHRYLAFALTVSVAWLVFVAWRSRSASGRHGRGPGSVFRMALAAMVVVVCVALLGAVTVKVGNSTWATAAHWTLAMTLV